MARFQTARLDGRSDREVVADMVRHRQPGDLLTYDELKGELERDTDRTFDQARIGAACRGASQLLLHGEEKRALRAVRDTGYRIAQEVEKRGMALERKGEADRKLVKAQSLLERVHWNELDNNSRMAHEGTLLMVSALISNADQANRRSDRIEQTIDRVMDRIERLEEERG